MTTPSSHHTLAVKALLLGRSNPSNAARVHQAVTSMCFLGFWSGRWRNTIAQANTLRRSLDGLKLPGHQSDLVAVSFLVKGRVMEATLVVIFVSIIDLPSIISIIGGVKAKRVWQVGMVAFLAASIGEVLTALVSITYMGPELFPYRLIAQIIV